LRKKLSRTKSEPYHHHNDYFPSKTSALTESDEELVNKLSFTPETQTIDRPPRKHAASVSTRFSERTIFNNVDSGVLSLPTEILVYLQTFLTPCSEVALRHSCSRFFNLYSLPSFYLAGEDQWQWICMTERDQDPRELDKLVCSKCRELHPRSSFPASEIVQAPQERDCRQVWLCAHRSLGYRKAIRCIKAGVDAPFRVETLDPCSRCQETIRNRSVADRPEKGTSYEDIESANSQSLLISKVALLQAPAPSYNTKSAGGAMYKEVFQVKDVSAALQTIDFRICPHLKLGDPYILSKFCRSCTSTQKLPPGVRGPPCISEAKREFGDPRSGRKCKGACYIRGCGSKFMFQAKESLSPDSSGRRQVWLIMSIYRWLGPLLTAGRDSTWYDHTVSHEERAEMRVSWAEWDKVGRGRQCMPNWSICLLHPEDCNLGGLR